MKCRLIEIIDSKAYMGAISPLSPTVYNPKLRWRVFGGKVYAAANHAAFRTLNYYSTRLGIVRTFKIVQVIIA